MSHTPAEYDHLDLLLRDWGEWQEKHCEDAMLPTQSAFCMMYSDQPAGSRILCAEMSPRVYDVNIAVRMLRPRYRAAVFVWYAVQLKDSGGYWTPDEKAQLFGCTLNALRLRISRAKRVLLPKYYRVLEARALQNRQFRGTSVKPWVTASAPTI
jgi:hypothetical protein